MKKIISTLFLTVLIISLNSCNKCDNISQRNVVFLIDVTDSINFKNIKLDISNNIQELNKQKKIFQFGECEGLTFKMGKLSESESISFSKIEREVNQKNLNQQNLLVKTNPDTIFNFISTKLKEYEKDAFVKSNQSNIANNILKTILENKNQNSTIFVFSDMIENNEYLLMYKNTFQKLTTEDALSKLFDPSLLSQLKNSNKNNSKLIIVQKQESKNLTKTRDVKEFWIKIFDNLGIKTIFIDDLSHNYN